MCSEGFPNSALAQMFQPTVTVATSVFLSFSDRFCLFMSVSVCFCPFVLVSVCFSLFLLVSVCLCLSLSGSVQFNRL